MDQYMKEYFIKKDKADMLNILKCCQSYFRRFKVEIHIDEVLSPSRKSEIIFFRALIIEYLMKKGLTYQNIADVLGKKTHSSVLNLKYDKKKKKDYRWDLVYPKIKGEVTKLEAEMKIEYHLKEITKIQSEMPIV